MKQLRKTWQLIKHYRITLILSTLMSCIFFTIGAIPESLYFNKEAINNGEVWRLVTAHIVHSDLEHLVWNLCALIMLSLLIESDNRKLLITSLIAGVISIDYYLWFNSIEIINYAGFSGVLNTLLVIALFQQSIQQWKNNNGTLFIRLLPVIIYIASLLKIVVEIIYQQAIFSNISWQAVPQVHLIGFIAGTLLAVFIVLEEKLKGVKINRPNLLHSNG